MVVAALVDDLGDVALEVALDLLLGRAVGEGAFVITTRIFASLHLFLAVFAPVVAVVGFFLLSNILRLLRIGDLGLGLGWLLWWLRGEILRETMLFGFGGLCCRKLGLFVEE